MKQKVTSYIMPTYNKRNLEFTHGKGVYLFTKNKDKYLDFGSGIAVNSLGHCHPKLVKVINEQSKKFWHTSNLYYNEAQEKYAKLLCKYSFAEKVFFTNSGTESIECGLKTIRSYYYHYKNFEKKNIITFEGAFHGRTIAALSTQKNNELTKGFAPLLSGFVQVPFNNLNLLEKNINETTAAILIETIQGEGGIRVAPLSFLEKIKNICIKNKILLFLDEVQSGFGRTGKLFSYQWSKIEPDLIAVAKGIGSGFPMGACLATNKSSIGMSKGSHGSTFGGNPIAIAVGTTVINEIMKEGFLEKVDTVAKYFWEKLTFLQQQFDEIIEVRGSGLLLGIKTQSNNYEISKLFEDQKLLTVPASDNVVRFLPPLIINFKDVDYAIQKISKALENIKK